MLYKRELDPAPAIMQLPLSSSISLQNLKAHLLLMRAFQNIHQKAEQAGVCLDPTTGLPIPTSNGVLFLARSLQRFETWVTTLNSDAGEPGLRDHEIPPLDVLMFLHAYMLSPLDFYEDSVKRHKVLSRVEEFPLSRTAELIDERTLELNPTPEQVAYWENVTSQPFNISFAGPGSATMSVSCPRCRTKVSIPWTDVTVSRVIATALPQYPCVEFQIDCATCSLNINPSSVRAGRFLQDIHQHGIAHTVLDTTGSSPDFAAAKAASTELAKVLGPNFMPQTVGDTFNWNIERLFEYLATNLDQDSDLHVKILEIKEAYLHPSDFAINLTDAVFRQVRFIFQMSTMGWLDPGRFDNEPGALIQALRNYEHLLRVNMDGMIVRWDIDLIFHTHQLSGSKYRDDTMRIIGRVLDHDDKQPQDVIAQAAGHAETVWKETFGSSYLVPHDVGLVTTLARTVCGGSTGGACVVKSGGGNGGNGQKGGGGGKSRAVVLEESHRAIFVH